MAIEYKTLQKAVETAIEKGLIPVNDSAVELMKKQNALKEIIEEAISSENKLDRPF